VCADGLGRLLDIGHRDWSLDVGENVPLVTSPHDFAVLQNRDSLARYAFAVELEADSNGLRFIVDESA